MAVYKVFTWNMQRAQSVSRLKKVIRERYRVLEALVNWADFGFITEPGMDIRNNLNNFNLPGLNRNFCASQLADNQTDASACRPVIYSKVAFSRIPPTTESYISYLSGGDDAYRYPAAGIVTLPGDGQGHKELLLLSFHATSGYNANENCQAYFDSFYQLDYMERAIPLLWIVGGDFNCNAGRGIYMPATSTHQSDHVLDGFFADQNGTNFQVTQSIAAQTYLLTNGGEGRLITNTHVDPHGYVVNGHHLSDHCPVWAQLQIERFSGGVDPANIVTSKRIRRQSTKYEPPSKRTKTKSTKQT
jgi:hypothetical protein